jgi:penicillin-binding protein 1B
VLEDQPLELVSGGKRWQPENYDGLFRGPVTARRALEESLNVPTVRAAQQVGLPWVVEIASRCGMPEGLRALPSLALGAQEVSPMELASAYGTLAAGGTRVPPAIIRAVIGSDGEPISGHVPRGFPAVSPQAAYLVTDLLRGVLTRGTAASASAHGFEGDAAGKTGTTDNTRDAWFVGYTPELLALVWVGYDDNAKTGLTGASGALPIWTDFMMRSRMHWGTRAFPEPEGIVRVDVDPSTGERATWKCPERIEEVFALGTEPEDDCHVHNGGMFRWFRRLWSKDKERVKPAV